MLIHDINTFESLNLDKFSILRKTPFHDDALDFLNSLSRSILQNKKAKIYPDLVTFGFFCRKANLIKNRNRYENEIFSRLGYGLCVHISPSNIPINFAFSFLFGLLSGNSNIIRLPSKSFEQNTILLKIMNDILIEKKFKNILDSTIFFNSTRDSKKLDELCEIADSIVVWGGDDTVNYFKNKQKKINCTELYFPNRVSSLVINSNMFIEEKNKKDILSKFYNDTYLVDQNACSSPSNIFWLGDEKTNYLAKKLFWNELSEILKLKSRTIETISIFDKYINVMKAIESRNSEINLVMHNSLMWEASHTPESSKYFNLGLFSSTSIDEVSEIIPFMRDNEQTLTYYEVDPLEINDIFKNHQLPIDRIVPLGDALDIGLIWDGKDIIRLLSKYTQVS
tara:strand:- start:1021 stop:2205 length:1185 start_codon:yes stop_codon:yes gene_type:complete